MSRTDLIARLFRLNTQMDSIISRNFQMNYLLRSSLSVLLIFSWLIGHSQNSLAVNYTSVAGGIWDNDTGAGGVWSPDGTSPFYPTSGDQITINNHGISLDSDEAFGGIGTASQFVGSNQFFTLANNTLTHEAGGTFTHNGGGYLVWQGSGTGLFVNDGNFIHAVNFLNYQRDMVFQNNGQVNITAGGTWQMDVGNTEFQNNGLYEVINANHTMTGNATNRFVTNSATGTFRTDGVLFSSGARFENSGTIEAINGGQLSLSSILNSSGTVSVSGGNTSTLSGVINSSGVIQALAGSTLNISNEITSSGSLLVDGAGSNLTLSGGSSRLIGTGGIIQATNGSLLRIAGTAAGGNSTAIGTQYNTGSGGEIRLGGRIGELDGIISGTGNVTLQGGLFTGQPISYIDLSGGTVQWTSSNNFHTFGGNTLELRSDVHLNQTGGYTVLDDASTFRISPTGSLEVTGGNIFYVRNGMIVENDNILRFTGGSTFQMDVNPAELRNNGLYEVTTVNHNINGNNTDRFVTNSATGTIRTDAVLLTSNARFENSGTIEAINGGRLNLSGILNSSGTVSVSGGNTSTLSGAINSSGVIEALAGSTLNISNEITSSGSLLVDGAGSNLTLSGGSSRLIGTGGIIQSTNGSLLRIAGTATGGNSTAIGTQYNTGSGGEIRLGGRIGEMDGTMSGTGNVTLQGGLTTGQPISYIDISGGTIQWIGQNTVHTLNGDTLEFRSNVLNDNTLGYTLFNGPGTVRVAPTGSLEIANGSLFYVRGGTIVENDSTINITGGTTFQMDSGPAELRNNGLYEVTGSNHNINGNATDRFVTNSATGTFRADGVTLASGARFENSGIIEAINGGTLNLSQILNTSGTVRASGASSSTLSGVIDNSGIIESLGGSTLTINNQITSSGTLKVDGVGGTLTLSGGSSQLIGTGGIIQATNNGLLRIVGTAAGGNSTAIGTQYNTGSGGEIRLGGRIGEMDGIMSGTGNVTLQGGLTTGQPISYIDISGGTIQWIGQNTVHTLNGDTLEFRSNVLNDNTLGYTLFNGPGTIRNAMGNTMDQNGNIFYVRGGTIFENAGDLNFIDNVSHTIQMDSGIGSFVNTATGKITLEAGTANINTTDSTRIFNNQGTVELQSGTTFSVNANGTLSQWNGTDTLTGGTWRILANSGDTTTLNLDPANAGITKLGADATVVLYEQDGTASAVFSELAPLDTIDGTLLVHGSQIQTLAGSGVAVSGTLGGDGEYIAAGGITFTGGVLDPRDLNGSSATLTIHGNLSLDNTTLLQFTLDAPGENGTNDLIEVDGDLVLDGILDVTQIGGLAQGRYRLFNYTGSLTDNGLVLNDPRFFLDLTISGQVNLGVVPEPSTGLLLLLGLLAVRRKRK